MKTFFKKASLPRQLRKKHFLREYNSLHYTPKTGLLPFPVSPRPTKMVEAMGSLSLWPISWAGINRAVEWAGGGYGRVIPRSRTIRILRHILHREIFTFIQAKNEKKKQF